MREMSLLSAAERLVAVDRSAIVFDRDRCLHTINKYVACEACFQICPVDAIQVGTPPSFDENRCQTCLACIPVCPTGAYSADDAVPALLNCAARLDTGRIEVICEAHPDADFGLSESDIAFRLRGCLAGIGSGGYLGLVALGMEKVIVRLDACGDCPWEKIEAHIARQIQETWQLLASWKREEIIEVVHKTETGELQKRALRQVDNPPLSRRDLFRLASQRGQILAARAMTSDENHRIEGHPSRNRFRIIAGMKHLPDLDDSHVAPLIPDDLGFAEISISALCSACSACTRACPTNAIHFQKEETSHFLVTFSPELCIGCEICQQVCVPDAITINHRPSFSSVFGGDEAIVLHEGELIPCDRCNVLIAAKPDTKLCPICDYRRKNPFGAKLPPKLMGIILNASEKRS